MNATGWSRGLEVTGGGTGVVSHAGVVLLRQLADKTGLTGGLSKALASGRLLVHDRGRVLADLACAIADGAEVISDFRVIGDQRELFGLAASVPTCWRALEEVASGGARTAGRITAAVNLARRSAWARAEARHGALPGVRVADKVLDGVTCIRLDATVIPAHSDKQGAEPNFKGYGHHPLLAFCDNTGEPLAGMLRPGSAGSNTAADHLTLLDQAIAALPPKHRRRLMVTCDGAGASHDLVTRMDALASRRGYQVTWSVGWEQGEREKRAIATVPARAWQIAVDGAGEVRERRAGGACADRECGHRACWIEEAHVTELTGILRGGRHDDIATWPQAMRHLRPPRAAAPRRAAHPVRGRRRLAVHPVGHQPGREDVRVAGPAGLDIDAAHRVHARVEDGIRTGKDTGGIGKFPSHQLAMNRAWFTAALTAATLIAWLKLIALDGDLARAEPKTLRYRLFHAAARLVRGARRRHLKIAATWPWADAIVTAWERVTALPQAP